MLPVLSFGLVAGCLTPEPPAEPACTTCHGAPGETAGPPAALGGITDPAHRGVGAHARHATPNVSRPVPCTECHLVPDRLDDPGHIDTDWPAEVGWGEGEIAALRAEPFDADGLTCTVYCHTAGGASLPTPSWTGGEVGCGSCHGNPPPPPHPNPADRGCADCHPGGGASTPLGHVDGVVQLDVDNVPCYTCHGEQGDAAPPLDLAGGDDPTTPGVGAHQTHVEGTASSAAVPCDTCHPVPTRASDPGHLDPLPADVLAGVNYDGTACTSSCHDRPGAANPSPIWTVVDGTQARCGDCHSNPPPPPHPDEDACADCHEAGGPGDPTRHVDGTVDFAP